MVDTEREHAVAGRDIDKKISEDGGALQRGKDVAGHDSAKRSDGAVVDRYPFAVGARQTDKPVVDQAQRQRAQNLHLFTAHHIGPQRIGKRHAGDDGDAVSYLQHADSDVGQPRRGWHIRHFHPTAVRPDRAGQQ